MTQFLNKKLLAPLVLAVILLGQVGFVLAGDVPDGGVCTGDDKCQAGHKCCCCPAAGCDANHEGICGNANCTNIICPFSKWRSVGDLVMSVSNYVFYIGVILAPLMLVVGGFVFMTSGGDPSRSTLGKNIIKWAAIGLGFILFAKGIGSIIAEIVIGGG